MSFSPRTFALTAVALVVSAAPAFSQMAFVEGTITDADGKTVTDAVVAFENA
jgi:hypothetical protein